MLPKVQDTKLSSVFRSSKKDKTSLSLWKGWVTAREGVSLPPWWEKSRLKVSWVDVPCRVFHLVFLPKAEKEWKDFKVKFPGYPRSCVTWPLPCTYSLGLGSRWLAILGDSGFNRRHQNHWGDKHLPAATVSFCLLPTQVLFLSLYPDIALVPIPFWGFGDFMISSEGQKRARLIPVLPVPQPGILVQALLLGGGWDWRAGSSIGMCSLHSLSSDVLSQSQGAFGRQENMELGRLTQVLWARKNFIMQQEFFLTDLQRCVCIILHRIYKATLNAYLIKYKVTYTYRICIYNFIRKVVLKALR